MECLGEKRIPRARLTAQDVVASVDTQQQIQREYNFQGLEEHVVGKMFTVISREGEQFFCRFYSTSLSAQSILTIGRCRKISVSNKPRDLCYTRAFCQMMNTEKEEYEIR